jgi:hypothetical protein
MPGSGHVVAQKAVRMQPRWARKCGTRRSVVGDPARCVHGHSPRFAARCRRRGWQIPPGDTRSAPDPTETAAQYGQCPFWGMNSRPRRRT